MTVYRLEIFSSQQWSDVRYREYTMSATRAANFKTLVKRINFTDSGHGLVPLVSEHKAGTRRLPLISTLRDHVVECMAKAPRARGSRRSAQVERLMNRVRQLEDELAALRRQSGEVKCQD